MWPFAFLKIEDGGNRHSVEKGMSISQERLELYELGYYSVN